MPRTLYRDDCFAAVCPNSQQQQSYSEHSQRALPLGRGRYEQWIIRQGRAEVPKILDTRVTESPSQQNLLFFLVLEARRTCRNRWL